MSRSLESMWKKASDATVGVSCLICIVIVLLLPVFILFWLLRLICRPLAIWSESSVSQRIGNVICSILSVVALVLCVSFARMVYESVSDSSVSISSSVPEEASGNREADASPSSVEPDWHQRQEYWLDEYKEEFAKPSVGRKVVINLKNGSKMKGILKSLTDICVELQIKKDVTVEFQKEQISASDRIRFFCDDYAEFYSRKRVDEEKQEWLVR